MVLVDANADCPARFLMEVSESYVLRSVVDLGLEILRHPGDKAEHTASVPS